MIEHTCREVYEIKDTSLHRRKEFLETVTTTTRAHAQHKDKTPWNLALIFNPFIFSSITLDNWSHIYPFSLIYPIKPSDRYMPGTQITNGMQAASLTPHTSYIIQHADLQDAKQTNSSTAV